MFEELKSFTIAGISHKINVMIIEMISRISAGNICYYYLKHVPVMNSIAIKGLKINIYKILVKPVEVVRGI